MKIQNIDQIKRNGRYGEEQNHLRRYQKRQEQAWAELCQAK